MVAAFGRARGGLPGYQSLRSQKDWERVRWSLFRHAFADGTPSHRVPRRQWRCSANPPLTRDIKPARSDDVGALGEDAPADAERLFSDTQADPTFREQIMQGGVKLK